MRDYAGSGLDCTLSKTERTAWNAIKSVCINFLGNHKAENYREIFSKMFMFFQVMKWNVSLKLHFHDSIWTLSLKTWETLAMNTVKDFTKTFSLWKNISWEDGTVMCLQNAVVVTETPEIDYRKKIPRKTFLHLFTCKVMFIYSVRILCINN